MRGRDSCPDLSRMSATANSIVRGSNTDMVPVSPWSETHVESDQLVLAVVVQRNKLGVVVSGNEIFPYGEHPNTAVLVELVAHEDGAEEVLTANIGAGASKKHLLLVSELAVAVHHEHLGRRRNDVSHIVEADVVHADLATAQHLGPSDLDVKVELPRWWGATTRHDEQGKQHDERLLQNRLGDHRTSQWGRSWKDIGLSLFKKILNTLYPTSFVRTMSNCKEHYIQLFNWT